MKESDIINVIKSIAGTDYIGDDCAYLKDLDIVISQDSLVEDIHFKQKWCTPYQLGYKSIIVNISDILAAGAVPVYLTVALSMPQNLTDIFVEEFYKGAVSALHGAKIVGGDITGSPDKIIVSVTAVGKTEGRNISSRKNARPGYVIITKGVHGSSSAGLNELVNHGKNKELIKSHLEPILDYDFSETIALSVKEPYAMMDTSDGVADALFKIAEASKVKINVDYNKISHSDIVTKEQVLFGGEDYRLIAALPEKYVSDINGAYIIGYVSDFDGIRLDISGQKFCTYKELNVYNHFGDKNV